MVLSPQIFQINIPNSSENCCCVNIFTASFVYFPALRGGGEQKTPRRSASPVPGASGWSLPQPPSQDGRRDGLSPSTITPGAITPLPSWPLPFPSLYSYGSRTLLRNPLPAFRQPHPSPPRLERAGREHKSLSHIQALAQPHPLPRVTLPPELLFCCFAPPWLHDVPPSQGRDFSHLLKVCQARGSAQLGTAQCSDPL